jgi:glycosyltransferase involved in cell wall biosynthesis
MRVLICTPAYLPAREFGGPVAKVEALSGALRTRGHDVDIWTARYGGTVDDNRIRYFPRGPAYRWSPLVPAVRTAARTVQPRPDVVHIMGVRHGFAVLGARAFRRAGVPVFVEPLGMLQPRLRHVRVKRAFDAAFTVPVLRDAAAVIANSDLEADEIRTWEPHVADRVVVRPNPLALPAIAPVAVDLRARFGIPSTATVAITVTRISRTKGLDVLASAVARTENMHVVVVGPDDGDGARADVERVAHDRMHLAGAHYGGERDALVAGGDVFVLPSRTESFGNAAVEAAALGLPVVITDRCGAAGLLETAGAAVVVPFGADPLSGALSMLRDDPTLRARLAANGPAVRTVVDPDHVAAQQEEIYRQVLSAT